MNLFQRVALSLASAALWICPVLAHAAFSLVQTATPVATSGTALTLSITFSSSATIGDLIVCYVDTVPSPSSVTIEGLTPTTALAPVATSGFGPYYASAYAKVATTTSPTCTANATPAGKMSLMMEEWSYGAGVSAPMTLIDQAPAWAVQGTSVLSATTNTATPTDSNDLAIAYLGLSSGTTVTWGSGFTGNPISVSPVNSNFIGYTANKALSGTPATTATATFANGRFYVFGLVLFAPGTSSPSSGCACQGFLLSSLLPRTVNLASLAH